MFPQQGSGGRVTGDGRRGSSKRVERNKEKTINFVLTIVQLSAFKL